MKESQAQLISLDCSERDSRGVWHAWVSRLYPRDPDSRLMLSDHSIHPADFCLSWGKTTMSEAPVATPISLSTTQLMCVFSWCRSFSGESFWNEADVTYYIKTHLAQGDEVEDTSSRSQSKTRAVIYFVWEESPQSTLSWGARLEQKLHWVSLSVLRFFMNTVWITSRSHKSGVTGNLYVLNLYNYEKYPSLYLLTVELQDTQVNPKLVLKSEQNWGSGRFILWAFAEHPHWL